MGEQEWATCHANAADQTVHLARVSRKPGRAVLARVSHRRATEAVGASASMTDHAAPLIAKLTAELAASYVVRLCQREDSHQQVRCRSPPLPVTTQSCLDVSDGCGAKFEAIIVSDKFEGVALLERHRM